MKSVTTLEVLGNTRLVGRPRDTGLSETQRVALSQVLTGICARDFGGTVTAMAEAYGVHQSQLNDLIRKKKGAGIRFLTVLRDKTGLSIDTLLGLEVTGTHVVRGAAIIEARTADQFRELQMAADIDRMEREAEAKVAPSPPPRSKPRAKPARA